ncbi:MAG: signal recognition particle receptor subunit alpha, partial [Chloroflexota bacterium]
MALTVFPGGSVLFKLFRRSEKTEQGIKKTRDTLFGRVLGLLKGSSIDETRWDELEEALIAADAGAATAARL